MTDGHYSISSFPSMSTTPSIDQLKRAITISEQIQKLESELASILGASVKVSAPAKVAAVAVKTGRKKRGLSAEGRARIAAAQKARWAKVKGTTAAAAPAAAPKAGKRKKGKRNLSPEARARIVAAVKRRWAKVKKAK
ncbi:MAG: hypothetical protein ABJF10_26670 [Chthoniobacter sp.]|uniref:hypothetical protein n=1 Tax=Chthoniobacter sp. TaxID=2510640 RepID=UPI0032A1EE25